MNVEEVFSEINEHMIQGVMIHAQLADYYNFLGLKGYAKCHEYHFLSENYNFRRLSWYYLKHFNKLIQEKQTKNPNTIPDSWYKYTRQEVDSEIRKTAIKAGLSKWVNWEQETKNFYQRMYNELINTNEIAAANEIKNYIVDVDDELAGAQQEYLEKQLIDFNIDIILEKQEEMYKYFKKQIKELILC